MTSRQYVQAIFCMSACFGCADSNSAQPNGIEDGGSGSVTGTNPVTGTGAGSGTGTGSGTATSATNESTGGRSASGGVSTALGGSTAVSVGSGAGIIPPPSGGKSATGGSTGSCLSVSHICTSNAECCNQNCVDAHCYDIPVSTGGQSATGGRSSTGGSVGTAGTDLTCLTIGEMCSTMGVRQCCKSSMYQVVCTGTCQYAAVAMTGGSTSQ